MQPIHYLLTGLVVAAELIVLARAILRPHREPESRLAWVVLIVAMPVLGVIVYLLLGETHVGRQRRGVGQSIDEALPRPAGDSGATRKLSASAHDAPFALARTINGLDPTSGNAATLAADSNVAIDEMCADIDAARDSVHASFYIWLSDHNGLKVKDAFLRAARRGTKVRVLADALGSRAFIGSSHWEELCSHRVDARIALPFHGMLGTLFRGRIDLRNHRKSLILDNRVAWVGSQNAADPQFRIKPRYAPWVDAMTRWAGPVAQQCQTLFASDWMSEGGEDLSDLLTAPRPPAAGKIVAQVIGTGPTLRFDAMPTVFAELIHSARRELVITTPYFVPDEMLLFSLTAAARRGVRVVLMLPKRIDSQVVAATCRSYFGDLIDAGVEVWLYTCGLLHAKTMVVDGSIGLIGSANLDRRSFELNFENNLLFADEDFAAVIRARQNSYLADCVRVSADDARLGLANRLWSNFVAMMSPLL